MKDYNIHIEDVTVYAWKKCQSGKLEYTRKDLDKGTPEDDLKAWDLVYDSYIKEFGIGSEYAYILELQSDLAILKLDLIITENRMLLNKINALNAEIQDYLNRSQDNGTDITTTLIMVGKWLGYKVPERETTILELYKMIDLIKKESDKNKTLKNG